MKRQVTWLALATLCGGAAIYLRLHGADGLSIAGSLGGIGVAIGLQAWVPA